MLPGSTVHARMIIDTTAYNKHGGGGRACHMVR